MNDQKKYLIFSPANEYGGVNMDVGYIAKIISQKHQVKVISLGDFYKNSSVFYFDATLDYTSLNRILYQKNFAVRLLTNILSWVKPMKIPKHFRVENALTKLKVINISKRKLRQIQREILACDHVVLCSQLTSKFMKEIVDFASTNNKGIVFRTTGQITEAHLLEENIIWYNKVHTFIHHSKRNRDTLFSFTNFDNHAIIDQNAYSEERFLKVPVTKSRIKRFFTLSRLHKLKQLDKAIEAFLLVAEKEDILTIYGDGPEEQSLKSIAAEHPSIVFAGKIDFKDLPDVFLKNDCLIIASTMEAGPYTGVESMASATPIISTRVGSMTERLPEYDFFYDGTKDELAKKIQEIKQLNPEDIEKLSLGLRNRYVDNYSEEKITAQYRRLLNF